MKETNATGHGLGLIERWFEGDKRGKRKNGRRKGKNRAAPYYLGSTLLPSSFLTCSSSICN